MISHTLSKFLHIVPSMFHVIKSFHSKSLIKFSSHSEDPYSNAVIVFNLDNFGCAFGVRVMNGSSVSE